MTDRTFSARRGLLLGFLTLAALCGGLFGWGTLASLSGAVIAVGQVETEGGIRAVEHVDGGSVTDILVHDGGRVEAGDVLLRIDGAYLRSEATVLEVELHDLTARRNRLEAEFWDAAAVDWSPELTSAAETSPEVAALIEGHSRLFNARRLSREGFKSQLRERIEQSRHQISGLEAQERSLVRQIELLGEELTIRQRLLEDRLTPRPVVLEVERDMASLEGRAGEIAAGIAETQGRIAELETQILQIDSRRLDDAETQTREVQAQEAIVRERLEGISIRLERLEVRAPVAGIVHNLSVTAVGEVLQPGETVAEIVPEGTEFIARVRVDPIHIDQVWHQQEAMLRFSAFSQSTTPEYLGTVNRVSADALTDPRSGLAWYEVDITIGPPVEPDPETGPDAWLAAVKAALGTWLGTDWGALMPAVSLEANAAALPPLGSGMPVEAYLRTGERSPLSYLVKPLTDFFEGSMREE
ncbi:MAG: HlyD family type I secretion periplasmic adaptor subunit [Rhodospirillaceae bacterium]|nr:HlyD family type I secretion periplasmic adaptor subunit [Rhodospirillaceae bacterium]